MSCIDIGSLNKNWKNNISKSAIEIHDETRDILFAVVFYESLQNGAGHKVSDLWQNKLN